MSTLPQEIHDDILQHLTLLDDANAMKAYALTARAFTTPAQRRLFSRITIRGPLKSPVPLKEIGGSAISFKYLLHSSPHIAHYVKCLEIHDDQRTTLHMESNWYNWMPSLDDEATKDEWLSKNEYLAGCLSLLTSLKAFLVRHRSTERPAWIDTPSALIEALFRVVRLPTLIYIDLTGVPTSLIEHGVGPNVRYVSISNSSEDVKAGRFEKIGSKSKPFHTSYLHSFQISVGRRMEDAIWRFAANPSHHFDISNLTRLNITLDLHEGADIAQVSMLLGLCANTLEELAFNPYHSSNDGSIIDSLPSPPTATINLSALPSLTKLFITLKVNDRDSGAHPWFLSLLRTGSAEHSRLEELYLDAYYDIEAKEAAIAPWKDISQALLDISPKLKKMSVYIHQTRGKYFMGSEKMVKLLQFSEHTAGLRGKEGLMVNFINADRGHEEIFTFPPDARWTECSPHAIL